MDRGCAMARFRNPPLTLRNNDRSLTLDLINQPDKDLARPGSAIIVYGADCGYKDVSDTGNGGV